MCDMFVSRPIRRRVGSASLREGSQMKNLGFPASEADNDMLFESTSKKWSVLSSSRVQLGSASEWQRVQRPSVSNFSQTSTPVQRSRQS